MGFRLTTVKLSPKYQVVIPKEIRNKLKLRPGQRLQIIEMGDSVIYITDKEYEATVWTQDPDFMGLDSVKYFPKN